MAKDLESFEPTKWSEAGIKAVIRPLIEERLEVFGSSVEETITNFIEASSDETLASRREFKDLLDQTKEDVLEALRQEKGDILDYVNQAVANLALDAEVVEEGVENPDDEDVETLKRIFRNYPKSLLWMTAGLFVGIGTGHLFTAIGIWGTLLVLGWISDGTKLSFSKKRDPWSL